MYTIKHASRLTGISEATLRAWERRYGLVTPHRSPSGYRLYDKESVARILAARQLVDAGWAPAEAARAVREGDVPALTTEGADRTGPALEATTPPPKGRGAALEAMEEFLRSAADMDVGGVEHSLDRAFGLGSFEHVVESWLFPTLTALGEAWAAGSIDVAGEHMASAAVHRRLSAAYAASGRRHRGPVVAVGLPSGSRHELGALAFAAALQRLGVNALFLGADVPVNSWAAVAHKPRIAGVVLAVVRSSDCDAAARIVDRLKDIPSEELFVAIGGAGACHLATDDVHTLPASITAAAEWVEARVRD
ncbi:MAG TPA: MerR family transcriptional regulator [Nocardioides sp.]|nr:MerR family transcriptional regulator [Nocardioides sp.]